MSLSFLMIKPDSYNRCIADDVRIDVLALCRDHHLKVVGQWTKKLTREEVLRIYPTIREKSFSEEFMELMVSNYSTLILVNGIDAVLKTKLIRGDCRHSNSDPMSGIRGKYCYVEDISADDWDKLLKRRHPDAEKLISIIIGGVVHVPDDELEVQTTLAVFN